MSVREGNSTIRNEIGRAIRNLDGERGELMNKNRFGGHRGDLLKRILRDLNSAIAQKDQEHIGSNAKNRTTGVGESQIEIGQNGRNMGLRLKKEISKQ